MKSRVFAQFYKSDLKWSATSERRRHKTCDWVPDIPVLKRKRQFRRKGEHWLACSVAALWETRIVAKIFNKTLEPLQKLHLLKDFLAGKRLTRRGEAFKD